MKKILSLVLALLVLFALVACGNEGNTDTPSGKETGMKQEDDGKQVSTADYKFDPPADGYRVEITQYYDGEVYREIITKKDNVFIEESEHADQKVKYDFNAETAYLDDWNGSYGWTEDGEWFYDAGSYDDLTADEFDSFDEYFMEYFYGYGFEAADLTRYCTGTGTVAGCNCWIINANGFNGITDVYWVNMENGICMKITDAAGNVDFVVTVLNLNY